ncbi:MAG: ATP-binding protein [Eubacteriaceae bacterium]|nr:ATP-binding protein [Eubacteriaceae bacterium]
MSSAKKNRAPIAAFHPEKLYRRINISFSVMAVSVVAVGLLLTLLACIVWFTAYNRSRFVSFSQTASEMAFSALARQSEENGPALSLQAAFTPQFNAYLNENRSISVYLQYGPAYKTNNDDFLRIISDFRSHSQDLSQKAMPTRFSYKRETHYYLSFSKYINGYIAIASFVVSIQFNYLYAAIVATTIGICLMCVMGFVFGLGSLVARRALSPLASIAASVRNVTEMNMLMPFALDESSSSEVDMLLIELNHMLIRLESAFEEQKRFVSDVSHELRIPLTIIQGYIDILTSWGLDDKKLARESLSSINDEILNMRMLVDKLLFLQNLGSGNIELNMNEISLAPFVKKIASEAEMLGSGHKFVQQGRGRDIAIYADRVLLEQSMRAAIDNAVKYSNPESRITIGYELERGKAALFVRDTGAGIPKEHLGKVKERFYRVDRARSKTTGGSGLGLSIIDASIKAMGGEFAIDSVEGKGTSAKFIFAVYKQKQ